MLTRFRVKNFKCFSDEFTFDLSNPSDYAFNPCAIRDGIVNKALIYGYNGCGKSNLGLALLELTAHLTDNHTSASRYASYLNLNSPDEYASFSYEFRFLGKQVVYSYHKKDIRTLLWEQLVIDGHEVIVYNYEAQLGAVSLAGTENLKLANGDGTLSRVKFVRNNSILADNLENQIFNAFISFVEHMLLFFSLDTTGYQDLINEKECILSGIINRNKVDDFQVFLRNCGLDFNLVTKEVSDEPTLCARFRNKDVPFSSVWSTGTRALTLFFYWYIQLSDATFVFLDEFDAFYHFELSEGIVKLLKTLDHVQVILTTHNTDLLSNDLLRPDCFFLMDPQKIKPLSDCTEKELRLAHNLQKMFKAGSFHE